MNIHLIKNFIIKRKFLVTLFILWTLMTIYLTLFPVKDIGHHRLFQYDKVGHAGMFLGWTYLLGLSLHLKNKLTNLNIILTCTLGALFGGLIEILQYVMPYHRDADIHDFYADVVGCLIALYLLYITRKKLVQQQATMKF
jgi:VanZ family protein